MYDAYRAHPEIASILLIGVWLILTVALLWPLSRERLLVRTPFVLSVVNTILVYGLFSLPRGFPEVFQTVLGHSVYARKSAFDDRWIDVWHSWVSYTFMVGCLVALAWASVNLFKGKGVLLNILALAAVIFWIFLALVARLLVT